MGSVVKNIMHNSIKDVVDRNKDQANLYTRTTHKQITSEGALFESFQTIGDWTLAGAGGSQVISTNCKQGTGALQITATNQVFTYSKKTINQSFATTTNFSFWVYVADSTKLTYINIAFSSDGYSTKSMKITLDCGGEPSSTNLTKHICNGWNHIVVDKTKFVITGGESWDNVMNRLVVVVFVAAGQTTSVIFDDLRIDYTARPKVMITFDDGYENVYTYAMPTMNANGQHGVFYVPHANVGFSYSWALTISQMRSMYAMGHDISNHTWSHPVDLTVLSSSEIQTEINKMNDFLSMIGCRKSKRYFAYPYYIFNNAVVSCLKLKNILMARTGMLGIYNAHPVLDSNNEQFTLKSVTVQSATSIATIQGYIDQLINQKGLLILIFHQIVASGATGTSVNTANFDTISNYLKTRSDAGLLDVESCTEYLNNGYK